MQVISYLNNTMESKKVIGVLSLKALITWVDAAYAVYNNMRSQVGGVTSLGCGLVHTKSPKQKIIAQRSIEAEFVGVSEILPHNI